MYVHAARLSGKMFTCVHVYMRSPHPVGIARNTDTAVSAPTMHWTHPGSSHLIH